MGRCQEKSSADGAHAVMSKLAICFAANIVFLTLELAHVTPEWAFAAVDKIESGLGATLSTAVLALVALESAFTIVGRSRCQFFYLRKVGQGHRVKFYNDAIQWQIE